MKAYKLITIITIILAIAVITAVSIFGIYKKEEFKMVNIMPKYKLGMEFTKSVILNLKVDDSVAEQKLYDLEGNEIDLEGGEIENIEDRATLEELGYTIVDVMVNPEELLTKENYEKTKSILTSRLIAIGAKQYNIRQDMKTGKISVELPDDANLELILGILMPRGTFQIVDDESKEILMDNSDIKDVAVGYAQMTGGTAVALQLKFNEAGAKKLEEISKAYIEIEEVEANEETGEEGITQKYISILIDGQTYKTTYFADTLSTGELSIYTGTASTQTELQTYVKQISTIVAVLKSGEIPITYVGTYDTLVAPIGQNEFKIFTYSMAGLLALVLIVLLAKFRVQGIYAFILGIGYISIFSLIIRLVDTTLTYEGIMGIIIAGLLNYLFIYMMLLNMKKEEIKSKEAMKNTLITFTRRLIPIYIIAILFIFATSLNLNGLGGTLFWGALLIYVYNITVTKILISVTEKGA